MNTSDLDLKDTRVPTFITFDNKTEMITKKVTKRKRVVQSDEKPKKRRATKKKHAEFSDAGTPSNTQPETQIWVGATIHNEKGSYAVYYGQDDTRNSTDIFTVDIPDLDYAYVLGTWRAIESILDNETTLPIIVNTICRDLPGAISGKRPSFLYQDMANAIRDLIQEKDIRVRHVSGRGASAEHKSALHLANLALENINKAVASVAEKIIVEETTIVQKEEVLVPEEKQLVVKEETCLVVKEENVGDLLVKKAEQESVTTTTATKVEVEINAEESMEEEKEKEEVPATTTSSWTSAFGIRNLLDVLYAPFGGRKST